MWIIPQETCLNINVFKSTLEFQFVPTNTSKEQNIWLWIVFLRDEEVRLVGVSIDTHSG